MLSFALTLALLTNHAATAQGAALQAVSFGVKRPTVVRLNVEGQYAIVLTAGGTLEGRSTDAWPILVERFSFGWQPLAALTIGCDLYEFNVDGRLMQGMPKLPITHSICRLRTKDTGPRAQVAAVRSLIRGPLIPSVAIAGAWALGTWYGAGGGESLYRLRAQRWHLVANSGGAMGVVEMLRYGVPHADWCTLGIYDCKNPER